MSPKKGVAATKSKRASEDEDDDLDLEAKPKPGKAVAADKKPKKVVEDAGDGDEDDEDDESDRAPKKKGAAEAPKLLTGLRATARTPERAEELKAKLGQLAAATSQIKALKRSMGKSFFEIGEILRSLDVNRIYDVKGYGSFEAFVEREVEIGKQIALKLVRIVQVLQKNAALEAGYDRCAAAVAVFDGEEEAAQAPNPGSGSTPLPPSRNRIPLHKQ